MKKLFSILLAIAMLLCTGLLPASASTTENKDDSRLDIEDIFDYYHTVTFVDGENESVADLKTGEEIIYPELSFERGYDYVWSSSQDEYSQAPSLMPKEDITVYALKYDFVGFENYSGGEYIDSSNVVGVSSDYFYSVSKSLKYQNLQGSNDNRQHSIALGKVTADTAYKISFKYYLPATVNAEYSIQPYTGNIDVLNTGNETDGMRVDYTDSKFTINEDTPTGEWLDGTIYFTADEKAIGDYTYTYLWLKASESGNQDTIYFDHITTEQMVTANFVINDNVILNSTNGVLNDNVFTAYYPLGWVVTAPVVITLDGAPVLWNDEQGNKVTEFDVGGVYYIRLNSKGDLNADGAVSTMDLSLIKLYLVEAIDGDGINMENADINSNGKIDIIDMGVIKRYLAGVITEL